MAVSEADAVSHVCDNENVPARVSVDGTRIPVINEGLTTEIRKREATTITHHSEVYFPVEWQGTDYLSVVDALDPTATDVYDPVDVEIRDPQSDEFVTVHRGFVMGVGGGSHGSIEHHMTVGDPGQLLGAITFDETYVGNDIRTPLRVLDDAITRVEDTITPEVFDEIERQVNLGARLDAENVDVDRTLAEDGGSVVDRFTSGVGKLFDKAVGGVASTLKAIATGGESREGGKYQYVAKKHAVSKVIEDLQEVFGATFYFEPGDEPGVVRFVFDLDGTVGPRTHLANHVDRDAAYQVSNADLGVNVRDYDPDHEVSVLRNNALHEIRPVNSLTVQGERTDGVFPRVTAVHTPLRRRQQIPLRVPIQQVKTTSIDEVEQIAKSRLKEEIDGGSLGRILTEPAPHIRPFDKIIAQPACGRNIDRQTPPFGYEVERVSHNIAATAASRREPTRMHETQLSVNVFVSLDDIVTVRDYVETGEIPDSGLNDFVEDT